MNVTDCISWVLHGLGRQRPRRIRRDHRVHPWLLRPLYAIANGLASLDTPLPPLSLATFQLTAFLLGIALLLVLEGVKRKLETK